MTKLLEKDELCREMARIMDKLGCPEVPEPGDSERCYMNIILHGFHHLDGVIANLREEIERLEKGKE